MANKNPYDNRNEKKIDGMYERYLEWCKAVDKWPLTKERYYEELWQEMGLPPLPGSRYDRHEPSGSTTA